MLVEGRVVVNICVESLSASSSIDDWLSSGCQGECSYHLQHFGPAFFPFCSENFARLSVSRRERSAVGTLPEPRDPDVAQSVTSRNLVPCHEQADQRRSSRDAPAEYATAASQSLDKSIPFGRRGTSFTPAINYLPGS